MLVHGAALDSHLRATAPPPPFSRPGRAAVDDDQLQRVHANPRRTRSSSSARQSRLAFPAHMLLDREPASSGRRLRTPSATSNEIEVALLSSRTRATVPSRISRTIGSSASERAFSRASPVALRLAPDAADHVLADRPGKHRVQRASARGGCWSLRDKPSAIKASAARVHGAGRRAANAAPRIRASCRPRRSTELARHGDPRLATTMPVSVLLRDARGCTPTTDSAASSSTWFAPTIARDATTPRKVPPPASSR